MATAVGKDAIAPMVQDIMQAALKVRLQAALCPSHGIAVILHPCCVSCCIWDVCAQGSRCLVLRVMCCIPLWACKAIEALSCQLCESLCLLTMIICVDDLANALPCPALPSVPCKAFLVMTVVSFSISHMPTGGLP